MTKKELMVALDAVRDNAKLLVYNEQENIFYTHIDSFSRINDTFIINIRAAEATNAKYMFNQLAFELPTTE